MKVIDYEKTIATLREMRKMIPGRNGILPHKFLSKEGVDLVIQRLGEKAIEVDVERDAAIIRCRDCIHYGEVGDCEVHQYDGRFNRDYFCADGERRERRAENGL